MKRLASDVGRRRWGCLAWAAGWAVVAAVIALASAHSALDFFTTYLGWIVVGYAAIGLGFAIYAASRGGAALGRAARRKGKQEPSAADWLAQESAALSRMGDRSPSRARTDREVSVAPERRRSTPSRRARAAAPRFASVDTGGGAASFTYTDSDGVVTDRRVRNWIDDGDHIQAFDLTRRAVRTFRKDRIEDWSDG